MKAFSPEIYIHTNQQGKHDDSSFSHG